jgi:hypothetical protein
VHHVRGQHFLAQRVGDRLQQLGAARHRLAQHRTRQLEPFRAVLALQPVVRLVVAEPLRDHVGEEPGAEQALVDHLAAPRRRDHALVAPLARVLGPRDLVHDRRLDPLELARGLGAEGLERAAAGADAVFVLELAHGPHDRQMVGELAAALAALRPRVGRHFDRGDHLMRCGQPLGLRRERGNEQVALQSGVDRLGGALLARTPEHQLRQHPILLLELRDQFALRDHQRVQRLHILWQFKRAFHRVPVYQCAE